MHYVGLKVTIYIYALLFGLINPLRMYRRVTVTVVGYVCMCVCVSLFTSGASVRPENTVTYSAGNRGQNICGVFSESGLLQRSSTSSVESHS